MAGSPKSRQRKHRNWRLNICRSSENVENFADAASSARTFSSAAIAMGRALCYARFHSYNKMPDKGIKRPSKGTTTTCGTHRQSEWNKAATKKKWNETCNGRDERATLSLLVLPFYLPSICPISKDIRKHLPIRTGPITHTHIYMCVYARLE